MDLPFTHRPGRRERQLQRRHDNPLFAWPPWIAEPEELLAAQRDDHEELEAFRASFAALIQRAMEIPPETGSDVILALKEDIERHYEQACGLPEDQSEHKAALAKLLDVIVRVIHRHGDQDPVARQELADEAQARALHFRLLESTLVVDFLNPETLINPHEVLPALLSASAVELATAAEIFDANQLVLLIDQGEQLLMQLREHGVGDAQPREKLAVLRERLDQYEPMDVWRDPD